MGYKRYEKYKDSGVEWIGEIPTGWEILRLKNFIKSCKNGIWGEESQVDINDIACVRVTDFNRTNMEVSIDNLTIRNLPKNKQKDYLLRKGDLLIEKSGGGEKQAVGFVVAYNHDLPAIYTNFIAKIELKSDFVYQGFLKYVFAAMYSMKINVRSIKQTTGIQNLDTGYYFNEMVPIPSLDIQKQIANFLDQKTAEIDSLIADKEKLIQLLQEKRQAIISEAVTKGLDRNVPMKNSGVEWIGEIPEHWELSKVKYFYDICLGKMIQPKLTSSEDTLEYYLCSVNVTWDGIDTNNLKEMWFSPIDKKRYEIKAGDLIVCEGGDAGRAGIWDGCIDRCYIQNAVHRVRGKNSNNIKYLYYWLYFLKHEGYIDLICNKATITHYTYEKFANTLLIMPVISEQNQIVEYLDKKIAEIKMLESNIQTQIAKLKEYRQSLIYEAVTGKIDVRDFTPNTEGVVANA
ncbi:MAG: restriction endonuclease subunit S [Thermoanaerobacteraceae bacterium]|nr:restriction endonuclease subunit S [Thermoanaerobacteraceae bacterium]